jgi:hypothetical protein
MTDYWSTQDGRIYDVLTIECVNGGAITEGSTIKMGTTAADAITVVAGTAIGAGYGVALKAASATTGEVIPVMFFGVYKFTRSSREPDITAGKFVMGSVTEVVAAEAAAGLSIHTFAAYGGGSWHLGMALQDSAAHGDKILVLVGKTS